MRRRISINPHLSPMLQKKDCLRRWRLDGVPTPSFFLLQVDKVDIRDRRHLVFRTFEGEKFEAEKYIIYYNKL